MKKEKLYFTRLHDQWRGKEIAVEEEIKGGSYSLYIQTPDVDITEGSVNSINATFKNKNGVTYVVGCAIYDSSKRIFKVDMPLSVLANEGVYEVVFSISYNSNGSINRTEKTAIQTFTILNTIDTSDEVIEDDDRYSILTQLIDEISKYKVDTSKFASKEDVQKMIDTATENFTIEAIKTQLEGLYVTPQQLNNSLSNYVSKFDSAQFAKASDLNYYVKNITLNSTLSYYAKKEDLNKYVLKENGKSLSSNDFTDELYEKLINMSNNGVGFDDSELRKMISEKADMNWVVNRFENLDAISKDNYYDIAATDKLLDEIKEDYVTDINNLSNTINTDINNLSNTMNTEYLKKEDYKYLDGISIDDIKVDDEQTLSQLIKDVSYEEIEIKNFNTTYITNIREVGTRIDYVELQWELNKTPISQTLTEYNGNMNSSVRSAYINKSYNKTQEFILTVSDEKVVKSEKVTVHFVSPYFYGSYRDDKLTADIIRMSSKIIDTKKTQTIRLQYEDSGVFFAYPNSYGYLIDIKDGNGLSYNDDFTMSILTINNVVYNVYALEDKTTVSQISFSFIFREEEE